MLNLLLVLSFIVASSIGSPRFRVSFKFSPLIGGPAFLPIHVSAVVLATEIAGSSLELDFVPVIESPQQLAASTAKLLQGGEVQGIVRARLALATTDRDDATLIALGQRITEENCNQTMLSLLHNNCYHFAFRSWRTITSEHFPLS
jgi:hypothetical protein